MPCPVCKLPKDGEADHRFCVLELLKAGNIQKVADWCRLCEVPETKKLGKVKVKIQKPKPESSS